MLSNHLILCRPLFLLPPIFPSIRVFSNESALCIRWPEYWSFSNNPSSEYPGLVSFSSDWFDLLAVQGTLTSLLYHTLKVSIFGTQPSLWTNSHICTRCCCCLVISVMSDSVQPHRLQPTRLLHPWDFPGKSTRVGCHCPLGNCKLKPHDEVSPYTYQND